MGNGYETSTFRLILGMLFFNVYPPTRPRGSGDRGAGEAEHPLGLYGGSINHWGIALLAILVWSLKRDPRNVNRVLAAIYEFLDFQLNVAFMCRGQATELLSPTHLRQHLQYILGFLFVADKHNLPELRSRCIRWIRFLLALCKPFVVSPAALRSKVRGKIVLAAPGFRAARQKAPGGGFYGSRDSQAEQLFGHLVLRHPLRSELLNADPLEQVDDGSLILLAKLEAVTIAELRAEPCIELPPLRTPIRIQRAGPNFVAYLVDDDGEKLAIQRYAGLIDGELVYGFDNTAEPRLSGAKVQVLGKVK